MFVAGETQEIANETAVLVEQIVRDQVIHLVSIQTSSLFEILNLTH